MTESPPFLVSVVMPCLNEAETLERCISKARRGLEAAGVRGEILVADNGSTDGSQALAERLGARVVAVSERGYGSALRGGIQAAAGRYIVMGDSDDSYDFSKLGPFLDRLVQGDDLVMGNRFKGGIQPGAMPWKHRWIGNPVLTAIGRLFFRCPVGDFHCGLRAFTKAAFERLDLRSPGMEFASEMVIKAGLFGLSISEVPVVLHKDGRSRPPHLRSWRDGWRHLRLMLLLSPLWLFFMPGISLFLTGTIAGCWLYGGLRHIGSIELDVHSLLGAAFMSVVGFQLIVFAVFAKGLAIAQGLHPPTRLMSLLTARLRLEFGVIAGLLLGSLGLLFLLRAMLQWKQEGFGHLDTSVTMRAMIPATTLLSLGFEVLFASFLLGTVGMFRRSGSDLPSQNS